MLLAVYRNNTNWFERSWVLYFFAVQVKSAALDCCRLLSREKGGLNEAVTQVRTVAVIFEMWFVNIVVVQEMVATLLNLTGIESPASPPADEKVRAPRPKDHLPLI